MNGKKAISGMNLSENCTFEIKQETGQILLVHHSGEILLIEGKLKASASDIIEKYYLGEKTCYYNYTFIRELYREMGVYPRRMGTVSCRPNPPIRFYHDRIKRTFPSREISKHTLKWYWKEDHWLVKKDKNLKNEFIIEFSDAMGNVLLEKKVINKFELEVDYNDSAFDSVFELNKPPFLTFILYCPGKKYEYTTRERAVRIKKPNCFDKLEKSDLGKMVYTLFLEYEGIHFDYDTFYREMIQHPEYGSIAQKLYNDYLLRQIK